MATSTPAEHKGLTGKLTAVLVLLAVAVFINYIDRGNLSLAAPLLKDELGLSGSQLGILLSAFFWTYACLQPISGWLVDRVNVNWVMAGGFCLWSCATAATGVAHAFLSLLLLRMMLGIGESITFPSCSKIIALHFREEHRGLANSVVSAGLILGPGFGMLFGGMLMARTGWRPFFIVLGLASLCWTIPWIRFMPEERHALAVENTGAPSFTEFLRLRSAWGTCAGLFAFNYANYFLITWLPFYLVRERHFSMDSMAKIGGAAYLLGALFATLAGWLSDRWISAGGTPTRVRKSFAGGGLALAGLLLGLFALSGPAMGVALTILGVIFLGVSSSNIWAITQTLAGPQAAGRWTGFQNFVGNWAGMVGPALTGFVLDWTGHFYWAFAIMTAVALGGAASWFFLVGQVRQVAWGVKPQAGAVSA
ncbi:MAG TPA: MFS transporter [Terriglobales bacterium]|nr:MFS transporter [Terriglobales bacterium]